MTAYIIVRDDEKGWWTTRESAVKKAKDVTHVLTLVPGPDETTYDATDNASDKLKLFVDQVVGDPEPVTLDLTPEEANLLYEEVQHLREISVESALEERLSGNDEDADAFEHQADLLDRIRSKLKEA